MQLYQTENQKKDIPQESKEIPEKSGTDHALRKKDWNCKKGFLTTIQDNNNNQTTRKQQQQQ